MSSRSLRSDGVSFYGQSVGEALLYAIVVVAPWALGCTGATSEFYLVCAVATVVGSCGIVALVDGPIRWNGGRHCHFALAGLLGLATVAWFHLVALPTSWVHAIAPGVESWGHWDLEQERVSDSLIPWVSGNRVGLNAGGSFQFLVRLGVVVGLFCTIQTYRSPSTCLRRLSVVAAVTGTTLSIFGMAQHFGSHDGLVYWTYEIQGGLGFGPFVNRNHYPFFINLTLGLTLGLLMKRLSVMGKHWYKLLLTDAWVGWLLVGICFMVASLIACGSRGGVISSFLAISIVMLLRLKASNAARGVMIGSLVAVPTTLVLIWVGFNIRESRLTMLTQSDRYSEDGRWQLWRAALPSVPEFPVFGSGGDTYQHWETIHQSGNPDWSNWKHIALRADNEFLDVLNEYGVLGLVALLILTAAIISRAMTRCRADAISAGASIGLLAVVFHSFADFGLRVPATAALAIVVSSLLLTQSRRWDGRPESENKKKRTSWSGYVASGCFGIVLIGAALGSLSVKHRYYFADQQQKAAYRDLEIDRSDRAVKLMVGAVAAVPGDLSTRFKLASVVQYRLQDADLPRDRARLAQLMVVNSVESQRLCPIAWQSYAWRAQYDPSLRETKVAIRWFDSEQNPVTGTVTGQLAALLKARSLHPSEPDLAYLAGKMMEEQIGLEAALPHWNQSLVYSTHRLPEIYERVGTKLSVEEIVTRVVPNDPVRTLSVARFMTTDDYPGKEVLLERTLEILNEPEQSDRKLSFGEAEDLRSQAQAGLGRVEDAIESLDRSIQEDPENVVKRIRMVELLIEAKRWKRATSEIRILLVLSPDSRLVISLQQQLATLKAKNLQE